MIRNFGLSYTKVNVSYVDLRESIKDRRRDSSKPGRNEAEVQVATK
jgi:hypothetical protein